MYSSIKSHLENSENFFASNNGIVWRLGQILGTDKQFSAQWQAINQWHRLVKSTVQSVRTINNEQISNALKFAAFYM
jgi:hypothetical protein